MSLLDQLSARSRRIVESTGATTPSELAAYLESRDDLLLLDFLPGAGARTLDQLIAWGERNGVRFRTLDTHFADRKAEIIKKYKWRKEPPQQSGWYWIKPRNSRCRVIEYDAEAKTSRRGKFILSNVWWSGPLEVPKAP